MFRLFVLLFLPSFFGTIPTAESGQPPPDKKRLTYVVKFGPAKELAPVLAKHFKGISDIQALPDSQANCLLISASPSVLKEVTALLEQVDRKPRQVVVDLWIVERTTVKGEGKGAEEKELRSLREFTGPTAKITAMLETLKEKGLCNWKHLQGKACENKPVKFGTGVEKSITTSVQSTATGLKLKNYDRRFVGTSAEITLSVSPERAVLMDLVLSDSSVIGSEEGPQEILHFELKTRLLNPSDHAMAADGTAKVAGKPGSVRMFVIVVTRVLDSGANTDEKKP